MLTIVPQANENERIRSIIVECWKAHMSFPEAVAKLQAAGFGAKEINEYQEWAKANPMPDDVPKHEHRSPRDKYEQATPFKEY